MVCLGMVDTHSGIGMPAFGGTGRSPTMTSYSPVLFEGRYPRPPSTTILKSKETEAKDRTVQV